MKLENEYIKIKSLKFHYKEPCIDDIGYDNIKVAICVPRTYFISSHAPSKLSVVFKKSGKVYINCNVNRTTGIINDSLRYTIKCGSVNLLDCGPSLEHYKLDVIGGVEYIFDITTNISYGCHTIWTFYHPDEKLSYIEERALEDANKEVLDPNSDYSLCVQTCNPKKKMAFRCIVSLLNNIGRLPNKIVVCSVDDINDGGIKFPSSVNFLCGRRDIFNTLYKKGVSIDCIDHIFNGFKNNGNPNMWLKYIIPRLCMVGDKILVLDDDVMVSGRCDDFIDSDTYLTFMEDDSPFYGERTIKYFNSYYKTDVYGKHNPFICAGVYMINKQKMKYDVNFINGLILKSEHDTDEQCAVGMEIIENKDYRLLIHPEYHHGGWEDQTIDIDKLNLIHMQGRAVKYRSDNVFIDYVMSKRIVRKNESG